MIAVKDLLIALSLLIKLMTIVWRTWEPGTRTPLRDLAGRR